MALTRIDTDQLTDGAVTNVKIAADASIAGSKLADDLTYGSNLTVSGNLTVNGTTTTISTTDLAVTDGKIQLAVDNESSDLIFSSSLAEFLYAVSIAILLPCVSLYNLSCELSSSAFVICILAVGIDFYKSHCCA